MTFFENFASVLLTGTYIYTSVQGIGEVCLDHWQFYFMMGRSVPDLAIVAESSLMSLLRWSYKTGMDKSASSLNGQITLVFFFSTCPFNLVPEGLAGGFQIGVVNFSA
jgi:hypothetical protein